MEPPSSDGIEIISTTTRTTRPPREEVETFHQTTRRPSSSSSSSFLDHSNSVAPTKTSRKTTTSRELCNVITISDDDEDESSGPQKVEVPSPPQKRKRKIEGNHFNLEQEEEEDDDVMIISGSNNTSINQRLPPTTTNSTFSSEDDDLEPLSVLLGGGGGGSSSTIHHHQQLGRSSSLAFASTSRNPVSSPSLPIHNDKLPTRSKTFNSIPDSTHSFNISSPPHPHPHPHPPVTAHQSQAQGKGKGKARQLEQQQGERFQEIDDDFGLMIPTPSSTAAAVINKGNRRQQTSEIDPWAAILESEDDDQVDENGRKKKKGKGKGKAKELDGGTRRKRLLNQEEEEEEEEENRRKSPPKKKASKSSTTEDKSSTRKEQQAAAISKTALKKQETLDRIKLREANSLKTKDKTVTAAELTVHISGTAFKSVLEDDDDDEEESDIEGVGGKGKRKKKKKKDKPSPWLEITEKLEERMRNYNCAVERPELPRRDIGCEGSIRWTRVCTTKWDDERSMFLPLPDGQPIVVEEDTRLIFLTAHDLSLHVARNTLSSFITTVQSQIPPHVNLFVLLFGLQTILRDLERVRQAEYKRELRVKAGEPEGATIKPAGIGLGQPNKDELELAIMRMQVNSRCMIVSVDKVEEAIDWLEQISFDVGQKPYQRHKQSHINVLGTGEANLPSGKDLQDTYIKMLASLKGVTEGIAKGIAGCYPTMRSLLQAWEQCEGGERGRKEMLVGIGKGRNIDGTATHRAIGATLSANIYRMLTSQDPNMFI
ncbi:hypothetical protein JCM3765_004128 [Sporobolomyces pararoseus]